MNERYERALMDLAARAALRARGDVEPNPVVGAVIVREADASPEPRILSIGHHRAFGGPHAEVEAIRRCRERGKDPRGMTMLVTLEPCAHEGKTPACTKAIIDAGLARVIIARRDPNPVAQGGAEVLRQAGIDVRFSPASRLANWISESFVKRITTGMPWVIAKWAQTIDGRIATREHDSKWISCEASRRRVHRLRACVDAIMTGEGTVLADDPMLTARDVARVRRVAKRVVVSPNLDVLMNARLITTADTTPTIFFCRNNAYRQKSLYREHLTKQGVEVVPLPTVGTTTDLDMRAALKYLIDRHGVTSVLVESGPGLLGRLYAGDLVDETHVYVAPKMVGDAEALPAVRGFVIKSMADAKPMRLVDVRRSGEDVLHVYSRVT